MAQRLSNDILAIIVAAFASSIVAFSILIARGWVMGTPMDVPSPLDFAIGLSIVFMWAPAFAFIPAAVLGFLLERPLARRLIARRGGGFVEHLLIVVAAALALWLALRIAVVLSGPQTRILDSLSLAIFAIIGVCSALSWWFLVVRPGRRA